MVASTRSLRRFAGFAQHGLQLQRDRRFSKEGLPGGQVQQDAAVGLAADAVVLAADHTVHAEDRLLAAVASAHAQIGEGHVELARLVLARRIDG